MKSIIIGYYKPNLCFSKALSKITKALPALTVIILLLSMKARRATIAQTAFGACM